MVKILHEIPENLLDYFLACVELVIRQRPILGTMDERKVAKELEKILIENQLQSTMIYRINLAMIGFNTQNIAHLLPLLKSPFSEEVYQTLLMLGWKFTHIRDIQIGIQKIIHLVRALKLYSHSEQDELGMTNLGDDIQTTLTILHNRLKQGITVVKEFEEVPEINCYADQLNQVWTNLINNAIEAMKGKGKIVIRLNKQDAQHVKIEIEDNGPGIPASVQEKIFDPYFTTKPKGEGTGIGLSISKEIIEKHHGTIKFNSSPGKTNFIVILPISATKI